MLRKHRGWLVGGLLLCSLGMIGQPLVQTAPQSQGPKTKHLIIIGCDGLGGEALRRIETPVLKGLMQRGAWTLHARGVMPTVSSPNWASMIMGAGPEQHGVTSNDWQPDKFDFSPTCKGPGGIFPTIYGLLKQQRPTTTSAVFHDWDGYGRLFERQLVDKIEDSDGPVNAVNHAVAHLKAQKPTLTFIHLDHVDHAGHEHGWTSPEYTAAVQEADRLIGIVLQGVQDAGLTSDTVVLITADHGGVGTKHGGNTMTELEIPWILAGPGIAKGKEILDPVNTYDTAATAAWLLGLRPPACWIARVAPGIGDRKR